MWEPENFADDGSLNILSGIMYDLINHIREAFKYDSENSLYDGLGESHIVARVDILNTLIKTYDYVPGIEVDEISKWKQTYLSTYDQNIGIHVNSKEYVIARRKIIVNTFEELYTLIDDYWSE